MSTTPAVSSEQDRADQGLIDIGREASPLEYLRELWERREFALAIAFGELRAQNQNTVLGNLWHLLNPLLLAAVFFFLFGVIFQRSGQFEPFLPYLVIGIFVFQFTQKVVMGGARAVVSNVNMMQDIRFPRALLPGSAVIQETVAQVPAIGAMVVLAWITGGFGPRWSWLLLLPLLAAQSAFNLGVALIVARATFHLRDVEQFLPYVMRMGFYGSGTFFPLSVIAERSQLAADILSWNPLNAFMTATRYLITLDPVSYNGMPYDRMWIVMAVWTPITLVGGFLWFRAAEDEYGLA